jgi:hypothetical protein
MTNTSIRKHRWMTVRNMTKCARERERITLKRKMAKWFEFYSLVEQKRQSQYEMYFQKKRKRRRKPLQSERGMTLLWSLKRRKSEKYFCVGIERKDGEKIRSNVLRNWRKMSWNCSIVDSTQCHEFNGIKREIVRWQCCQEKRRIKAVSLRKKNGRQNACIGKRNLFATPLNGCR